MEHQAFKLLLCRVIWNVNRQLRKTPTLGRKNLRCKTITKNKEETQKQHMQEEENFKEENKKHSLTSSVSMDTALEK